jgi:hypothetical protein
MRLLFFRLAAAHRIQRYGLYRGLLRDSPTENIPLPYIRKIYLTFF